MVGGEPTVFTAALPVLKAVGTNDSSRGAPPAGAGQTVKAANQLIVAGTIGRVAEAIVFLEAHGVSATTALEVLRGGLAGSTVLDRKGATMVARDLSGRGDAPPARPGE
jgi:2-hydroxy-3-oxopropionate reductase